MFVTGKGRDVGTSEGGAFWLSFLRGLVARGLSGVELVTSDAHPGLRAAIATVFAGASWQRCRTHFMRNLLTRVPKSAEKLVATTVRTIYEQSSAADVQAQHARVLEQLAERFPKAAVLLADAGPEILAFTALPAQHWRQVWSNNLLPRDQLLHALEEPLAPRLDLLVLVLKAAERTPLHRAPLSRSVPSDRI